MARFTLKAKSRGFTSYAGGFNSGVDRFTFLESLPDVDADVATVIIEL